MAKKSKKLTPLEKALPITDVEYTHHKETEDEGLVELTEELLEAIYGYAERGMKLKNMAPHVGIDILTWELISITKEIQEAYNQGRYVAISNAQAKRYERGILKSEVSLENWYKDVAGDISQMHSQLPIKDVGHEDVETAVNGVMKALQNGHIDAENAIQMMKVITLRIALVEPERAHTVMAIFDKSFENI